MNILSGPNLTYKAYITRPGDFFMEDIHTGYGKFYIYPYLVLDPF